MYILDRLWEGQVTPNDKTFRNNSQYGKLIRKAHSLEETFCAELSADGKQHYQDFLGIQMDLLAISEQDAFIRGVRLGAQFILDVTEPYHSQLPQIGEAAEEERAI